MNHNLIILSQFTLKFTLKDKTIIKPTTTAQSKCLKCYFSEKFHNEKSIKKKFLDNIWFCLKEI